MHCEEARLYTFGMLKTAPHHTPVPTTANVTQSDQAPFLLLCPHCLPTWYCYFGNDVVNHQFLTKTRRTPPPFLLHEYIWITRHLSHTKAFGVCMLSPRPFADWPAPPSSSDPFRWQSFSFLSAESPARVIAFRNGGLSPAPE